MLVLGFNVRLRCREEQNPYRLYCFSMKLTIVVNISSGRSIFDIVCLLLQREKSAKAKFTGMCILLGATFLDAIFSMDVYMGLS